MEERFRAKVLTGDRVTIPVVLRRDLGIEPGDEVDFVQDGDRVLMVVTPATRLDQGPKSAG